MICLGWLKCRLSDLICIHNSFCVLAFNYRLRWHGFVPRNAIEWLMKGKHSPVQRLPGAFSKPQHHVNAIIARLWARLDVAWQRCRSPQNSLNRHCWYWKTSRDLIKWKFDFNCTICINKSAHFSVLASIPKLIYFAFKFSFLPWKLFLKFAQLTSVYTLAEAICVMCPKRLSRGKNNESKLSLLRIYFFFFPWQCPSGIARARVWVGGEKRAKTKIFIWHQSKINGFLRREAEWGFYAIMKNGPNISLSLRLRCSCFKGSLRGLKLEAWSHLRLLLAAKQAHNKWRRESIL